jgi:hypothetical protein
MAQSFNGVSVRITTNTRTMVLNAAEQHVLHSMYIANKATTDLAISIEIERAVNVGTFYSLGFETPLVKNGTLTIDKPINLMIGDKLYITSSDASGNVDVSISSLKITA